jgi:hypothetical protein
MIHREIERNSVINSNSSITITGQHREDDDDDNNFIRVTSAQNKGSSNDNNNNPCRSEN